MVKINLLDTCLLHKAGEAVEALTWSLWCSQGTKGNME